MNDSIRIGFTAILVGLLVGLASGVQAQRQAPNLVDRLDPAWERLAQSNAQFLNKDQQETLDDLGFAAAVSGGCPGFAIDKQNFEQGFRSLQTDAYMKLPPDEKRKLEYRVMANYGATVALYTAEGLLHPKEACKFAEGRRDAGPGRFWVQTTGETPPAKK